MVIFRLTIVVTCVLAFVTWGISTTHAQSVNGSTTIVHMDETGFEPAEISINVGDTVVFENTGSAAHWPASDMHPSHSIYPEFDPKEGIAPGETWSFTFKKPGVWGYHDHLYPANTGTIEVVGKASAESITLTGKLANLWKEVKFVIHKLWWQLFPSKKDEAFSRLDMFEVVNDEEQAVYWARMVGAPAMMKKLIADSGQGVERDCHGEAHTLGRIGYELEGGAVFRDGAMECHSGFYHGAMEGLLINEGVDNFAGKMGQLCDSFGTQFGKFQCYHGVGHGVLAYANYDLPRAIATCRELPDKFTQNACYGGVFMENIVVAEGRGAVAHHETEWVSDDPHFPCNQFEHDLDVLRECYQMQTSRMITLYGPDFEKIVATCASTTPVMLAICYQSVGRDAAGTTLRNPEKIIEICDMVPGEYYNSCISGAVQVVIDFWGEQAGSYPYEFCSTIKASEARRNCVAVVAGRLYGLYGQDREKIERSCKLAHELEEVCLEHAFPAVVN